MAIDSKHPLYSEFLDDWCTMRDTYRGERIIKQKGQTYLPATSGQIADGMATGQKGLTSYNAYKLRASFPEVVSDAIEAMLGVMHMKPPTIELPTKLETMLETATLNGESLEMLLRRINEQQLITGRLGLLLDVPSEAAVGVMPYIALYTAENIINWDDGSRDELVLQKMNFVALDETEFERGSQFEWEEQKKYRILILGDPDTNEPAGIYSVGVFRDSNTTFTKTNMITPSIGGVTLEEIPFVFVNSKDIITTPDDPPLIGLAKLALTIYRGEADYRQSLFMQGQDTLVVTGSTSDDEIRMGANAVIKLPIGAEAKFIGVDSQGLAEQREALENDNSRAAQKGGQLLDSVSRERESGDALKVRVAARTSTLNQIALTGAFGLEQILKIAAKWVGANPEEVSVTPNLDFISERMTGKELLDMQAAKNMGAPISARTIHRNMELRDLTDMDFEEELAEIDSEEPRVEGTGIEDESQQMQEEEPNATGTQVP